MVSKTILIGNVGKDPETFNFADGGKVVSFSLATSENWKDQSGQRQTKTEWHEIKIHNEHLAGVAEQYVKKGSKLYVEGQIESRKYTDRNGVEREVKEIVLRFNAALEMLSSKPDATPEPAQPAARQQRSTPQRGGPR